MAVPPAVTGLTAGNSRGKIGKLVRGRTCGTGRSDPMLDDFVKDFLLEGHEGVVQFESQLLELERDPDSEAILASIFRVVHSIKGAAGFLGFPKMALVTHKGEELLGKLREGEIRTHAGIVDGLLALIDAMRRILASIEAGGTEGEGDDSALVARLESLLTGASPVSQSDDGPGHREEEVAAEAPAAGRTASGDEAGDDRARPSTRAGSAPRPRKARRRAEPEPRHGPEPISPPLPTEGPAPARSAAEPGEPAGTASSSLGESTIRVEVALLDTLMNLVGELVLTRNQILRCSIVRDEMMFQASSQRLNLITTELQEGMMKTRMQPIRNLSSKLPRVVRDLALACGKRATIAMEGEDTELDKSLGEAIKDPITHIVRNAVDHGIEPPEVRVARGKPAEGTLRLRAYHEGGMVHIELSDDGNGIDVDRVRRKARERGWLTEDEAARWSDRDLLGLIFRPGFSTAESTTMVSGRGVGMDVVKSRVESIGGRVEATSRAGMGTTIKMKIPLTLTIISALIVAAGGERFAIPQVNLVELIRLDGDGPAGVIHLQGASVSRYRGRLLPLIRLNEILEIGPAGAGPATGSMNIVVLQADQQRFGLVVDRIDDAQEIVVRPLARQLRGISCLAGATIMGDGRIALILDVFGLAKGLAAPRDLSGGPAGRDDPSAGGPEDGREALVLLRGTDASPMAVPLAAVDRLETFPRSSVEWLADRPLVQYRRSLLPLIDAAAWLRGEVWLGDRAAGADGHWQVVIHSHEGRRVGLVFERVVDIIEERLDVRGEGKRPGVLLTAALQGRATEILDVAAIRAGLDTPAPAATEA